MAESRPVVKRYAFNIMCILWLLFAFSVAILVFDSIKRIFDQNSQLIATYVSMIGIGCSILGIVILYMPGYKTRHKVICGGSIIVYILLGFATFVGDCVLLFAYCIPWLKDQRQTLAVQFQVSKGQYAYSQQTVSASLTCQVPHPLDYGIFPSIAMTIALTACSVGQSKRVHI